MEETFFGEIWKEVKFDFTFTNQIRIEVSNFGRVRSFTKIAQGRILNGSLINGYKIVRLKFFKSRSKQVEIILDEKRAEINQKAKEVNILKKKLKLILEANAHFYEIKKHFTKASDELEKLKTKYRKVFHTDELKRTINHAALIHRWVAEYFIDKPSDENAVVAHLDYYKLNNHFSNLKWMTKEESTIHQRSSPMVIASRKARIGKRFEGTKPYKLTESKVKLIKKKINQGIPLRKLAKTFNITETQLLRIKRGENWGDVKAAE